MVTVLFFSIQIPIYMKGNIYNTYHIIVREPHQLVSILRGPRFVLRRGDRGFCTIFVLVVK